MGRAATRGFVDSSHPDTIEELSAKPALQARLLDAMGHIYVATQGS